GMPKFSCGGGPASSDSGRLSTKLTATYEFPAASVAMYMFGTRRPPDCGHSERQSSLTPAMGGPASPCIDALASGFADAAASAFADGAASVEASPGDGAASIAPVPES